MKKLSILLFIFIILVAMPATAQDKFKLGGYMVAGTVANLTDSTLDYSQYTTSQSYPVNGVYYGVGEIFSRIRINAAYERENSGIDFRYQVQKDFFDSANLTAKNLKFAQMYARLLDGVLMAEAGALANRYTKSDGVERFCFSDYASQNVKGVRLVAFPIEGLAFSTQVSDLHDDTNDEKKVKLNKNLLSFSAKYKNAGFAVSAGYHLAKDAYIGFDLYAIKNLILGIEARYSGEKATSDLSPFKTASLTAVENIEYRPALIQGFSYGFYAKQYVFDDDKKIPLTALATRFEFTPHAQYMFTSLYGVQLESTVTKYASPKNDESDFAFSATYALLAAVTTGGRGARLFYTVARDCNKKVQNYIGCTIRVNL